MKHKLIVIIACIVVFTIAVAFFVISNISKDDADKRYHQHIEAQQKTQCYHDNSVFCTHLPLIQINTDNCEIPGKAIKGDNGEIIGYTQAYDGTDEMLAKIKITDNEQTNNHIYDAPDVESFMKIHVMSNYSEDFDKSSYKISLVTEDGENNDQSVMGMDAHSEWVLYAPCADKSLLKNYIWNNIAGEIMDYSPNVRFCEVMLNGEYQGLYVMSESITSGKEGCRLNLSVKEKDNTLLGYVLSINRESSSEIESIETFSKYAYRTDIKLNIVYPIIENFNEELKKSIAQDFSSFEKTLYSYDYDDKDYGYKNLIDVESFADYFILNEFTCNYDSGWFSTCIYKDMDGKYRLALWDYSSSCDNYRKSIENTQHFKMQNYLWYFMLVKDEDFIDAVIKRYEELRQTVLNEKYLDSYIDSVIGYLGDAIERDYEKWGYSFEEDCGMIKLDDRDFGKYEETVSDMKEFIKERGIWIDENIYSLKQYSSESRVKKFNENAN